MKVLRSILALAVVAGPLAGAANAQTVAISASGSLTVSGTYQCNTTTWTISASFLAGTTGTAFLSAVQAQLIGTSAFLAAGGSAAISNGNLIIDPGSDPNVILTTPSGCAGGVPLVNGTACDGLTFTIVSGVPTMSQWFLGVLIALLLSAGLFLIYRRRRLAIAT